MSLSHLTVAQFCDFHGCSTVIIEEFAEQGIFETHYENGLVLIPYSEISRLERALRIHLDLGVNAVGIDIILNLLEQLDARRFDRIEV
ncbi:chaperone modulator CbpM [Neolewinella antarctica]|uniref:MerR family transcriptional regulator n=1 Tax=Neolewinella antarctica TaxID=442734 RepID=A0ABX0X9V1_9BACT|nr:chaperone modulator CbpM [Neolewinella antarctica]NJC25593.1 hypothetical protein [Neolewinella antarctica]